jgi:hypothetical protein
LEGIRRIYKKKSQSGQPEAEIRTEVKEEGIAIPVTCRGGT